MSKHGKTARWIVRGVGLLLLVAGSVLIFDLYIVGGVWLMLWGNNVCNGADK